MGSRIIGCGGYLPSKVLTNQELVSSIDSSDDWIVTRTGIHERRVAELETNLDMAYKASLDAIDNSPITKEDINLIIVATTTNDKIFPSLAVRLQDMLGITNVAAFDIQAVCSGYVYGLHIADMISKKYKNILLVGSEKMSSITDWQDRSTCILFGDGAAATIIQRQDNHFGIIDSKIYADGSKHDILFSNFSALGRLGVGAVSMKGSEVFKYAVNYMKIAIDEILVANNMDAQNIDIFIPHQANIRIIDSLSSKMHLDNSKVVKTIGKHGNCSAASIPLALVEAKKKGILNPGDMILMVAFGGGLTWGTCLLRW